MALCWTGTKLQELPGPGMATCRLSQEPCSCSTKRMPARARWWVFATGQRRSVGQALTSVICARSQSSLLVEADLACCTPLQWPVSGALWVAPAGTSSLTVSGSCRSQTSCELLSGWLRPSFFDSLYRSLGSLLTMEVGLAG